jgi:predicted alpha/beta superfamily hydrolase
MPWLRTLALTGLLCASSLAAAVDAPPPPYVLEGTEVRGIRSTRLNRDYELYVSLPASYASTNRRYPVVFATDANYAFPVIRSIAKRVGNGGKDIEEFILVGLSYAKGDTPEFSRRRDYTPTATADKSPVSDMPGRAPVFGEAEAYRQHIATEVFPFVAALYRADMSRRVLVGHSYGSLLGVHVLLTEPTMFEQYVLGSPSLWFNRRVMFEREREYAATHRDLKARVFIATGAYETVKPASSNPRYNDTVDMVGDVAAFGKALKSRRYPGLHLHTQVIADEDHLTVAPAVYTRGLVWALGKGSAAP